jgi:uncharacterized protein YjbJ (UPF0337 family)
MNNAARRLRGRIKRNAGKVTGDRTLQAAGRTEEASSNLSRLGEKLKNKLRDAAVAVTSDPVTEASVWAPRTVVTASEQGVRGHPADLVATVHNPRSISPAVAIRLVYLMLTQVLRWMTLLAGS